MKKIKDKSAPDGKPRRIFRNRVATCVNKCWYYVDECTDGIFTVTVGENVVSQHRMLSSAITELNRILDEKRQILDENIPFEI